LSGADRATFAAALKAGGQTTAERLGGWDVRSYGLAGRPFRIGFASPRLAAAWTPALEHLETFPDSREHQSHSADSSSGDCGKIFTIWVWETAAAGIAPPRPPAGLEPLGRRGEYGPGEEAAPGLHYQHESGILSLLSDDASCGLCWVRDAGNLPGWEAAAPFRPLLHSWARSWGGHFLHAAAVGRASADRAVLLVGRGGSGKSSSALACLRAGWDYLGDDYVLVTLRPEPRVHCVYQSAKVVLAFLRSAFSEWEPLIQSVINHSVNKSAGQSNHDGNSGKAILWAGRTGAGRICPSLPLAALVQPVVKSISQPRLGPLRPSEGLLALGPSTLFQLPWARAEGLRFCSEIARVLPAFRLELGGGPALVPAILETLFTAQRSHVA